MQYSRILKFSNPSHPAIPTPNYSVDSSFILADWITLLKYGIIIIIRYSRACRQQKFVVSISAVLWYPSFSFLRAASSLKCCRPCMVLSILPVSCFHTRYCLLCYGKLWKAIMNYLSDLKTYELFASGIRNTLNFHSVEYLGKKVVISGIKIIWMLF